MVKRIGFVLAILVFVPGFGPACVISFREGLLRAPVDSLKLPPVAERKSLGLFVHFRSTTIGGFAYTPLDKYREEIREEIRSELAASGVFRSVTLSDKNADLILDYTILTDTRINPLMILAAGISFYILPTWYDTHYHHSARFREPDGRLIDIISGHDKMRQYWQLLLMFGMPFTEKGLGIEKAIRSDMNRKILAEGIRHGYFRKPIIEESKEIDLEQPDPEADGTSKPAGTIKTEPVKKQQP